MADRKEIFDMRSFYNDIDSTRRARDMNWKEVSIKTKVSTSTLARMAQERRPDADSLAALAAWSGLNPADYVRNVERPKRPESLTLIASTLRADPRLSDEGIKILEGMLRSTYQQLASPLDPAKDIGNSQDENGQKSLK